MAGSNLTRRGVMGGVAATAGLAAVSGKAVGQESGGLDDPVRMETFMGFSVRATGFPREDLDATGQADIYFRTVRDGVGDTAFAEFLQAYDQGGLGPVWSSPKHGAIARNIVKLWYAATWERLSPEWHYAYGTPPNDRTFVVSADAYTTGLLWSAIGVNPPGANAPGYGTWSDPPDES